MVLPKGFKLFLVSPGPKGPTLEYTLISPSSALALSSQAGAIMLALLASYGRPVPQEAILSTMYPADRPVNAVGVMRSTLARVREYLDGYGITFDIFNDSVPRRLGPSITLLNLRQHSQEPPQERPRRRPRPQANPQEDRPQAAPERSPGRRPMVRPINDVPWTFPARIENQNRRKAS